MKVLEAEENGLEEDMRIECLRDGNEKLEQHT